jgi:hypothetical protein
MFGRRDFMKVAAGTVAAALVPLNLIADTGEDSTALGFTSASMQLQLSSVAPEILSLNIDGLGLGKRGANIMDPKAVGSGFIARGSSSNETKRIEYRRVTAPAASTPEWIFELAEKKIVLISECAEGTEPSPLVFRFNLPQVHSTVLGIFAKDNTLATPALMHFPGQGSIRISANVRDTGLAYHSEMRKPVATLSLPPATAEQKRIVYTLEVVAIYPPVPGIGSDRRFDAFRRNWLNIFQLNPFLQALANNTASDTCAFCYYEYGDIAALTPPFADGLTALDVVRQTLDRILAGGHAYGLSAPGNLNTAASDTFPSLLIAAADCVRRDKNDAWLAANYEGIKGWADSMLATDTDGDGLIKYIVSGDSGIWPDGIPTRRPSNWWDTIGFGHEDAYANALAYRSLGDMAMMARRMGKPADAAKYKEAAGKLRKIFYPRFFDPETGILAGWRSADGQLHDYYFLWVNGIAIHYGLVHRHQANSIMDKLLAKMREVGYDKFNLGLPGNLITVGLKDCVDKRGDGRFGCGVRPDNADGFQNYENGGATGSFAFFTLAALYDLGRHKEADEILFAMLGEYDHEGFEGRGANDRSNDWRRWDGTPTGYEGFLTDNYYSLLAVPLRQSEIQWHAGYRPGTTLS